MIYIAISAIVGYIFGCFMDKYYGSSPVQADQIHMRIPITIIFALVGAFAMVTSLPWKTASLEESIEEYPIYAIDESKTYLIYDYDEECDKEIVKYATDKENNISQTIKVPADAKTYILEENTEHAYLEVYSYSYKDWWVWLFTGQSVPDDYVFHIPKGGV